MTKYRTLLTEEKLIEALQTKSRFGAEVLYDMYSKSLFGVLLKMVNNQELAEDLLQKSFLKIWTSMDCYDVKKGRLFTWMITITRDLGRDCLLSKHYQQALTTERFEIHPDNIERLSPEVFSTDIPDVKECVNNLEDEDKNILNLIYFQGYTHIEAAEQLDIPLGMLKTRCRKEICVMRGIFE